MSNIDAEDKRGIKFTIIIYAIIGFLPLIFISSMYSFITWVFFIIYIGVWFLTLVAVVMSMDSIRVNLPDKFNSKRLILLGALFRSGFITFFIMLNILLMNLNAINLFYGENYALTKEVFVICFCLTFIGTLIFYYFYEKKDFESKSFVISKKLDEFQNKLSPSKPIKIKDQPKLRRYLKYRNELSNIYDLLGIIVTALLLFTSTYTSFEPNSLENVSNPFREIEFLLLLLFMVIYIQAAYYKLNLDFLKTTEEEKDPEEDSIL